MRRILIIIIVFIVRNSLQGVQFYDEEITEQSELVNAVLQSYLRHLSATWNAFVCARDPRVLEKLSSTVPVILINDWDILTEEMSGITAGSLVVIFDGNAADDESYLDLERLRGVRTRQSILVMCHGSTACNSDVYLKKIAVVTNNPTLHYVVVDERESGIQIYERTKTAEGSCGVSRLVRLPYNTSDAWLNEETFSLAANFNKCPIRLITWRMLSRSWPCRPGDPNNFCGLEGEIIKNVVDKINATPVTTITKNYYDIANFVVMGQADLGYGNLHVDTNKSFVYSTWYMYVVSTIVVPHSAMNSGASLLTMAHPLNRDVWICFAVVVASIFFLGRFVPYFRRLTALQQFGTIIGISLQIQPRQFPQRIYFISIVFFGFWFTQIYLVNLTKIYSSVSKPHLIETLEEVEELGLHVYGGSSGKRMLNEFNYTRIAENNYKMIRIETHFAKLLKMLAGKSSDPIHVEVDVQALPSWKNVAIMKNFVRLYSMGLIASNSSSLMPVANRVILNMLESGIRDKETTFKFIGNDAVNYAILRGKSSSNSTMTREPKKLTLKDMQGVLLLYTGGLALSTLLFIVELVVVLFFFKANKITRKRKIGSNL